MFYSLTGKLTYFEESFAVIDCGGVGYKCFFSLHTKKDLPDLLNTVKLYTYLSVKEDAMDLFGFSSLSELNCFKLLISVSGVGTKMAIAILSLLSPEQVAASIAKNDFKTLTVAPGVGPKLAKRIILELKDKLEKSDNSRSSSSKTQDPPQTVSNSWGAVSALEVLGYSRNEIMPVLTKFDNTLSVEELIKLCLKELSRGV